MTPLATLIWLLNLVFDTAGQLAFKAASLRAGEAEGLGHWRRLASDWRLWFGIGCFILEFLMWLAFLSLVPLSLGVLVGCVNIIGVMLGGRLLFGERLTPLRTAAIALISVGVVLVGWGGA